MPNFSETVLSDSEGKFQFVNLHAGYYRVRCHGPNGFVFPISDQESGRSDPIEVDSGLTRGGISFMFPEAKKGVWKRIPIIVGLSERSTSAVHGAPDGKLWIGSVGSLQVYDGREFKKYASSELTGIHIRTIRHAADGSIWIGTNTGVNRCRNGQIENFSLGAAAAGVNVASIVSGSDGVVWFGTSNGLVSYDGERLATFGVREGLPSNVVTSLLKSRDGTLWVGTDNGLVSYDGRNFKRVSPFYGFANHFAKVLFQAKNGDIWFSGGRSKIYDGESPISVYRYDGERFFRLGKENGLDAAQIYDMAETSDGTLWFATLTGILQFNGKTFLKHQLANASNTVTYVKDIVVDADDVLWCATGLGVVRFDSKGFLQFSAADGLQKGDSVKATPQVFSIEPDLNGGVWIGTEWGGVYRTEGKHFENIPMPPATPFLFARGGIQRDDSGSLWFGTHKGIFKVDGDQAHIALDVPEVIAFSTDSEANLWYGHGWLGDGLFRHDPKTGKSISFTTENGLPSNNIWSIEASLGGGVWVGAEGGLLRYQNGEFENVSDKLGIGAGTTWNLFYDEDDTLWICTNQGLHRFDGTDVVSITSADGLPNENIYCATQTDDGTIWMGTANHGLLGYDGRAVTVIDKRDGLRGNSIFAVSATADDSLWLGFVDGMIGGLGRYQPSKTPPSVSLLRLQVEDQSFSDFSNLPEIMIGTRVAVHYHETDLKTHPEKRQFLYRVSEPSGKTLYSAVTKERRFEWVPQQGGSYVFEVQAIDRDLNYSAPAKLSFHAVVPWYANYRILGSAGGSVLALMFFSGFTGWKYLKKRREAEQLSEQLFQKEHKAREALEESNRSLEIANRAKSEFLANMSHEIRTPLNAVLGFAKILQQDQNVDGGDRRRYVENIYRNGEHLLTVINEILDLSKIEAGQLELTEIDFDLWDVISDLSAMFEPRCEEKGLVWRLEGDVASVCLGEIRQVGKMNDLAGEAPQLPSWPIRGDGLKLRQVLINILNNAVKFTDTGEITLRVNRGRSDRKASDRFSQTNESPPLGESDAEKTLISPTSFLFEVEDTGPGIPNSVIETIFEPFTQGIGGNLKGGTGLGLAIASRQVALMGGTVNLATELGKGARFYFSLELAPAKTALSAESKIEDDRIMRLPSQVYVQALVADDVPENRDILSRFLKDLGVGVSEVGDGEQALEEIRSGKFDIAFLDIRMPGLTGSEVALKVVEESGRDRVQLVAISASALTHERAMYTDAGFDAFMPKPFQFEELVECLKTQLGLSFEFTDESLGDDLDRGAANEIEGNNQCEPGEDPIDWRRFRKLFGKDKGAMEEFIASYLKKTPLEFGRLREGLKSGDASKVQRVAHRCKGLNMNFGIQVLVDPMEKIEAAATSGKYSEGKRILAEAEKTFATVEMVLEKQLEKK
ncbi:ATP-binding protein [Verrucomicrobia bacterium]|nr:ATP-binding protein [Verrucomicrobiota bacterium]